MNKEQLKQLAAKIIFLKDKNDLILKVLTKEELIYLCKYS